ncbi:MAG: hypothetical protein RL648_581 [Verrucomicrobiota bacterium]
MGVLVGDASVSGPTGVGDADVAGRDEREGGSPQIVDPTGAADGVKSGFIDNAESCRIIATVFQPPKSIKKDGGSRLFANVTNDTAHNWVASECRPQHNASPEPIPNGPRIMKSKVVCVIMGGGRGTRLHPLTAERCKPAVPLAGKYRLVDIPISNCLNSGLNQIYVLTQFNTASLHRHIQESYKFDPFGGGFVDILSAEQTEKGANWYQGTADAVRQNLHHLNADDEDLVLILSGDQLYQMDLEALVEQHRRTRAAVTVAAKAMRTTEVHGLGLMRVDDALNIREFVEKPTDPAIIEGLALSEAVSAELPGADGVRYVLANMGIYCFNMRTLRSSLNNEYKDFGKEVIPLLLGQVNLRAFIFDGYWEDIGTVRSFFDANLSLTDPVPPFNFFDQDVPVYTRARFLPASKINRATVDRAIIAGGAIVSDSRLERVVIGVRSVIRGGGTFRNAVMMGADIFESEEERAENRALNRPDLGVGSNCEIENAIIDKNARIGNDVVLRPDGKPDLYQAGDILVRDGIVIVMKNGVVPDGTVF